MSRLALFLFGPPRVELDNIPVKIDRHKAIALLAYLTITTETHSRNTLATLFWPNYDQSRARAALRRVLATLNKAGLRPWLEADRETIGLKQSPDFLVDVAQFRHLLAECLATEADADAICLSLLTEALSLYHADFMLGFSLKDSPDFDEWQLAQEENLRRDLGSALARLIRCHIAQEDFESAIVYAQRWLKIDPLYELAHRQLMQLYVWNGQRAAALRQYQECVRILEQELDTPPLEETTALYKRILYGEKLQENEDLRKQFFAPLQTTTPLHNFPTQPTPFVGRQRELPKILKLIQELNCRLLTLTGPGGGGKTRLAIQAAIELGNAFSDGIYFVPLASVGSPDFLASSIAKSLNFSLNGREDPNHQLLNYLRHKAMLLVMDNFEHLTKEVSLLLDILSQSPKVKILVTSRERLNVQQEHVFEVRGMSYPMDNNISEMESYGAIALFLQKAYRVHSDFSLTEAEKPYIIRICQLVEGLPLGIELAAAWVRILSCREIAEEIENRYDTQPNVDFLTTPLQDVPKRHQSLRGVFEHSWQLLSEEEKTVFKKLSVFRAGGSRAALEWVAEATLPLISALTDKSLLTRSASGRYAMHEFLRQAATEKLWEAPLEADVVYNRHCEYYITFLHKREKQLKGEKQKEILAEIAKEIENIRAAWYWAISQGKIAPVEQALESLWYFYAMYSWFQEGVEAFEKAVTTLQELEGEENSSQNLSLIGQILACQGWFLLRQGLYEQAKDALQGSIDICKQQEDRENMAAPLHYLGVLAGEMGQPEEARKLIQHSLAIYREVNNPWGIAWTLSNLGYHTDKLSKEHYLEAQQLLQESLEIYKSIGNKQGIAIVLNNLGFITYKQGDYAAAKELFEESLILRRQIGYPRGISVALNNLGHVTAALEDFQASEAYYYEALKIAIDIQTIPLALAALGGLAVPIAYHEANMDRALELVTIALHHPASNKETQDRAREFLAKRQPDLPPDMIAAPEPQGQDYTTQLESLVTKLLASQN